MKAITKTAMGLGLLYATNAQAKAQVTYSANVDIAPTAEQIPTVKPGQTVTYVVDPKTQPVVPVQQYAVQVWLTPYETLQNRADDVLVQYIPVQLTGPNTVLTANGEHQRTMVAPTKPGVYALYTESQFDGIIAPTQPYHRFIVAGKSLEIPFEPNPGEVDKWLESGIEFTAGGWTEPRWHNTFVPENEVVQYKAGPHSGRHFAVLGTPGYVDGVKAVADPCVKRNPCSVQLKEELYIVGATLDDKIINVPREETGIVPIAPEQELVARYESQKINMGTHLVDGGQTRDKDGRVQLENRLAGHTVIPNIGNLFAVEAVLYGIVGTDANNDGKITPDEQECVPLAWKAAYVQFVPRGYEAEAFIAGLGLGLIGGYLIPHPDGDNDGGHPTFPEGNQAAPLEGQQGNTVH